MANFNEDSHNYENEFIYQSYKESKPTQENLQTKPTNQWIA